MMHYAYFLKNIFSQKNYVIYKIKNVTVFYVDIHIHTYKYIYVDKQKLDR